MQLPVNYRRCAVLMCMLAFHCVEGVRFNRDPGDEEHPHGARHVADPETWESRPWSSLRIVALGVCFAIGWLGIVLAVHCYWSRRSPAHVDVSKTVGSSVEEVTTTTTGRHLKKGQVKFHTGPLELGADGVALKPKFNIGITGPHVYMMAGARDVCDGMTVENDAMVHKDYASTGETLTELIANVKAVDPVPVLDDIVGAVPAILGAIEKLLNVDISESIAEVDGVVCVCVGVGSTAGLFLGWIDTKGYRMIGADGTVACATGLSLALRVGVHAEDKKAVRVVIWASNVGIDAVLRLEDACVIPGQTQVNCNSRHTVI